MLTRITRCSLVSGWRTLPLGEMASRRAGRRGDVGLLGRRSPAPFTPPAGFSADASAGGLLDVAGGRGRRSGSTLSQVVAARSQGRFVVLFDDDGDDEPGGCGIP